MKKRCRVVSCGVKRKRKVERGRGPSLGNPHGLLLMASHALLPSLSLCVCVYSILQQHHHHHHYLLLLITPPRQSALSTNGIPPVPTVSPNDPDLISRLSPRFRLPHWRGWLFLVFYHVFIPDLHCHCGFSSPSVSPSFGNLVGSSSLGSLTL